MSNDVIYLSNVRLSFPNIAEPRVQKNDNGQERIAYGADLIMPESHAGYQQFMQVYAAKAAEKWKEHAQAAMQMIHGDRKARCYGTAADKIDKKTYQPFAGYAGNAYITVSSKVQPQLFDPAGVLVDANNTMAYKALAMKLYGGCFVNAAIRPWIQMANREKSYGNGIRCDLIGIQFAGDGEPFGEARPNVTGMFGQVAGAAPTFGAAPAPAMPAAPTFGVPGVPSFLGGQ